MATFNVRNGRAFDGTNTWWFRRRRVVEVVDALDATLLGLQEVYPFQRRYLDRHLPPFVVDGQGRNVDDRGESAPVLVDSRVAGVLDVTTRWYGDTPDEPGTKLDDAHFPRIATIATVAVGGRRIQFVNTHLDERSKTRRRKSVQQLAGWLDERLPRVVVGDFNCDPGDQALVPLVDAGLRPVTPEPEQGTAHDWTGRLDGRRLDHVFVSAEVGVDGAHVDHTRPGGRLPSDHWPLVAALHLR